MKSKGKEVNSFLKEVKAFLITFSVYSREKEQSFYI